MGQALGRHACKCDTAYFLKRKRWATESQRTGGSRETRARQTGLFFLVSRSFVSLFQLAAALRAHALHPLILPEGRGDEKGWPRVPCLCKNVSVRRKERWVRLRGLCWLTTHIRTATVMCAQSGRERGPPKRDPNTRTHARNERLS